MADVGRRRFLATFGLALAAMLMLTACPGGEGNGDGGDEHEGGGEDDD